MKTLADIHDSWHETLEAPLLKGGQGRCSEDIMVFAGMFAGALFGSILGAILGTVVASLL